MKVDCPLPTALTTIPAGTCPFRMDQIVRFGFMRRTGTAFTNEANLKLLASWTTKIAATDNTKIVMSPFFAGFVIPSSEALTTGGNDNTTFNGIPDYNGEGVVLATGNFKNMQPATKVAMDKMIQESLASAMGVTNLVIFFINKDGVIYYKTLATPTGVPIYNFRVGSIGTEGLNAPNLNPFSFNMLADWADDLQSAIPSFDPLTAI